MTYKEALEYFGTQVKIAAALGISQPTVSQWGGSIPAAYQYQIEVITGGELLVDDHLRLPADHAEGLQQQAGDSLVQPRRQMG